MLRSLTSCLQLFYCKKRPFYLKGGKTKSHEQKCAFMVSDCPWDPNIWHRDVFAPPRVTWYQCLWWNDWIIKAALLTIPWVFVQRSSFMNEVIGLMKICWTTPRAEHQSQPWDGRDLLDDLLQDRFVCSLQQRLLSELCLSFFYGLKLLYLSSPFGRMLFECIKWNP